MGAVNAPIHHFLYQKKIPMFILQKVISGGQTGVDLGALFAARDCGLITGGHAAKGFLNENGHVDKGSQISLGLQDLNLTYSQRTLRNIQTSIKTLIIFQNILSSGTQLTYKYTENENKPCFLFHMTYDQGLYTAQKHNLLLFLEDAATLNVAGNRESVAPGIQKYTYKMLCATFQHIQYIQQSMEFFLHA